VRGIDPPAIGTENTSFGTRIYAIHNAPNGRKYLRVNNYVYPCSTTASQSGDDVSYQGRCYVPIDDYSHYRFEFFYSHNKPMEKERLTKNRAENVAPDYRHVRRAKNRYLQDREEMKLDGNWSGMGLHFPSQDAFAIETQGAIQDRTVEMLGSSDVVIAVVRRTLLNAIKDIENGKVAPGQIRDPSQSIFADFICTSGYIEDDEDGPSYCRRLLAETAEVD
jgi:hypothetical protein